MQVPADYVKETSIARLAAHGRTLMQQQKDRAKADARAACEQPLDDIAAEKAAAAGDDDFHASKVGSKFANRIGLLCNAGKNMDKALSGHKIGFVGLGNMGGPMAIIDQPGGVRNR